MNPKLIELADQRATLVARAAAQRAELSQALASWRRPLALADQGLAAARYLRSNPMLLGGVVAFLIALRPWRLVKWLPRGWLTWRLARMALGAMGGKGILRGW
jgi:hypothetical protein